MGKLESGMMGPVNGRVGDLVFSTWKGLTVVKSRPRRRAERTENEKIGQHVFGMIQRWLRPIAPFLEAGFKNVEGFKPTLTARNIATSLIYRQSLILEGYNSRVDPARTQISAGPLPLADKLQMHFDAESKEVKIIWEPEIHADTAERECSSPADQLMLLIYNPLAGEAFGKVHGALRETGRQKLSLKGAQAAEYHVWVAFIAENRNSQSDSRYLGSVILE